MYPSRGYAVPEQYGEFKCDICGQPGRKTTRNQKRHLGECRLEYHRRKNKKRREQRSGKS